MALYTGCPVWRSQTTVVSRWLVMPSAATCEAFVSAAVRAPPNTVRVVRQISIGSCSTHPGRGSTCSCSSWSEATMRPSWSKTMARVLVVPWSRAST